jgi:hypothetical protein
VSFAGAHQWASAGTRPPGEHHPLRLRARVYVRRGILDRLLAAGIDPAWDSELRLRAGQITAAKRRCALSASLQAAVRDAHRPPQWTAAVPLAHSAVRAAAHELRLLAECLAGLAAPAPQGVALAEQLVRDPSSPLYAPGSPEALCAAARIAHRALNCPNAYDREGGMTSHERRQPVNRPADEARYPEDVGLKDFKFGVIGLGTCAGLAILFAIVF